MAGIYVHIPFCKSRCSYCDFHSGTDFALCKRYINALCSEMLLQADYLNGATIQTLYFGGGTPSALSCEEIKLIIRNLEKTFDLSSCQEITLECNPDDLNLHYLKQLQNTTINRLSIGIQSFNNEELRLVNRRHSAEEAEEAVLRCQEVGFGNISIDLIFGLPNQTLEKWKQNLTKALMLNVQHLSIYGLTYEKGTALWNQKNQGLISHVDEETTLLFFETAMETLSEGGFEHYEISNYARKGFISKHNSSYWKNIPYLGIGSGAHSYNGKTRQWNIPNTLLYCEKIEKNNCFFEQELLTEENRYNEYVMTALRTREGIDTNYLNRTFDKKLYDYFSKESKKSLRNALLFKENNYLKLTKKGLFLSDNVIRDLIY